MNCIGFIDSVINGQPYKEKLEDIMIKYLTDSQRVHLYFLQTGVYPVLSDVMYLGICTTPPGIYFPFIITLHGVKIAEVHEIETGNYLDMIKFTA